MPYKQTEYGVAMFHHDIYYVASHKHGQIQQLIAGPFVNHEAAEANAAFFRGVSSDYDYVVVQQEVRVQEVA